MKRLFLRRTVLSGFLGVAIFVSPACQEEEKEVQPMYEAGVLVSSNGASGGVVSFYDRATGKVEPDLFNKVNGRALEGQVLAMPAAFEKTYLITGNQKIEVLDSRSFTSLGVIEGLKAPHSFVGANNRTGFVSESLGQADSGRVAVVNLNTYQVSGMLKTGKNPGVMALVGNRLFVANAGSNKVNVFTITTPAKLETSLTVGDNPNGMVVDAAGMLWVLCGGKAGATKGQLVRINPNNLEAKVTVFEFPNAAFQPRNLALSASRNRLYFLYDGVYVMETAAPALPQQPLLSRNFQALAQDPTDGLLYTARANADGVSGWVIRYRTSGAAVDSFEVPGVPNGFSFR